jgi:hypothetical protein
MNVCEQCGSSSRDKSGICAGCGAPWPLANPAKSAHPDGGVQVSPLADLPSKISFVGLVDAQPKPPWAAILLALFDGPIGLVTTTFTGGIVMLLASIALESWLGRACFLIIPPLCAFWAWRVTR